MAQTTPTRITALSLSNPSAPGAAVPLRVHVDALGPGAPTGWVSFWDGATRIGDAKLGLAAAAGQTTLSGHSAHNCALTAAGGVKCWGDNGVGQLGNGTTAQSRIPVDVTGLTSGAIAVAAGSWTHSCAVTSAGGAKCWGHNGAGQLGDGTKQTRLTPVDVARLKSGVVAVTAGYFHSCALTRAGGVKCWGSNGSGQLGDGTGAQSRVPVDVLGLTTGVRAVAAGYWHSCALTAAGGVKCWGYNTNGQLGDGTTTGRLAPVDVTGLRSGVVAISASYFHSCAVTRAGLVKCWGSGALGNGTMNSLTPVTASLTDAVAVSAGVAHTCALTRAGAAMCWGGNGQGQLGDGTTTQRLTPVVVSGMANGVTAVTAGDNHSCATRITGEIACWGQNGYGQLGDGTAIAHAAPAATLNLSPLIRASVDFVTPPLAAGPHWLRAFYRGDATHTPALGGVRQKVE